VAIDYFSRGRFAHFDLAVRAISIRRRIASGRVNEPSCSAIQESKAARSRGCTRTNMGAPFPVGGGPRFFRDITD
jgi:hypothetical protein